MLTRRQVLAASGAALGLSAFPLGWTAAADAAQTQSPDVHPLAGLRALRHQAVDTDKLALAEQIVTDLGAKNGFEVTCTKDGRVFLPETIAKFDAFLFETTGDLTKEGGDKQPADAAGGQDGPAQGHRRRQGLRRLPLRQRHLPHRPATASSHQRQGQADPYIAMLGGEFINHGAQQKAVDARRSIRSSPAPRT